MCILHARYTFSYKMELNKHVLLASVDKYCKISVARGCSVFLLPCLRGVIAEVGVIDVLYEEVAEGLDAL